MAVDRDNWLPPDAPQRRDRERVPGAMSGSLLLDQPQYAELRAAIEDFVAPGPPLAIEVGFDHGINLLANARLMPGWRWLGCELRRRRVHAVQGHAPANCLPVRLDARSLLARLIPAGRAGRVDILFPTPALRGRHLLLTDHFVADLARALAPDGVLHLRTDVPALAALARELLADWRPVAVPRCAPDLSRRERVCRRDGIAFEVLAVAPP